MLPKKNYHKADIPTSSMADIAFLLLIFFLVATVIDVDTGIGITLPEISDIRPEPISKERMAAVLINDQNEILLDKQSVSTSQIKYILKDRISSKIDQPKYKKLIVSLKTGRLTKYSTYISVLDQIKLSFFEVRNEYSNYLFGKNYNELDEFEKKKIKESVPIIISLAEPETVN
jgi:biopolymer transport protein ExbD